MAELPRSLIIACGALAHELTAVIRGSGWRHLEIQCLPARLHNTPERITDAVRGKIQAARGHYDNIYVAYADCGTGGRLDAMLAEEGVERIGGDHCYEFFTGSAVFHEISEFEPATFYLTDYLVRHFDRLIIRDLGIEAHPELQSLYFGNYRRLVYLAQRRDEALVEKARAAAQRLDLEFEYRPTGLEPFKQALHDIDRENLPWPN
ncbi:MAG TPA: DUF1638 domain-containing protein [Arenicellales bacterium]|nr:DUF1638 domain-containing protein [Arenicellales bacterium]